MDQGVLPARKQKKIVKAAVAAKGIEATILKITDFQEIAQLGIFSTPAVVIDGKVKSVGNIPKQSDVEKWIS